MAVAQRESFIVSFVDQSTEIISCHTCPRLLDLYSFTELFIMFIIPQNKFVVIYPPLDA